MYIISKFHDYYDTALGLGIDKTIVYQRNTNDLREKDYKGLLRDHSEVHSLKGGGSVSFDRLLVGFCGKLYPLIIMKEGFYSTKFLYNFEAFQEAVAQAGLSFTPDKKSYIFNREILNEKNAKEFFEEKDLSKPNRYRSRSHKEVNELLEVFRKEMVPCFLYDHNGLVLNPRLDDLGFQKLMDPYTAFQELSMFLSGVLGETEKETVKISDKDKLHKHGFYEWSFKNLPSKK